MSAGTWARRIAVAVVCALLAVAALVLGWQLLDEPASERQAAPVTDSAAQLQRGQYLARAGNCAACHTARGGKPYAGGRAIATPFGDIYASNLTPDSKTGIGDWSADDFWRALHHGESRDGSFLYPAFPYTNFTKITRDDADALYAYLRSVPAVEQANREHALRFPFNQRLLLAFWRTLYFTPGEFQPDPKRSAEYNRGSYLVQGPGHCAACHTSRNALGGSIASGDLAGGMIPMQHWQASSLSSDPHSGLGSWHLSEIEALLKTGVSARGAVYGPMAEVVAESLQHLSDHDIHAIAVYLRTVPKNDLPLQQSGTEKSADAEARLNAGAKIYANHCAGCHQSDGRGQPPAHPPLAGKASLSAAAPTNAIRIVLNGGYPPSTSGNPRPYGMPPYSMTLNDEEVAAVVSYVRNSWGNKGSMVSPIDVDRLRGAALHSEPVLQHPDS